MQLKNYSILNTKNAHKLLTNRFKYSQRNRYYKIFDRSLVDKQPHRYFTYHDLNNPHGIQIKSYPDKQSALKASQKIAKDEALNPNHYDIKTQKLTWIGAQKKFDRIHSGKGRVHFATPKSSDVIYNAYRGKHIKQRSQINLSQEKAIHQYQVHINGGYYGNDIFAKQRKKKYPKILKQLKHNFLYRRNQNIKLGKHNLKTFNHHRVNKHQTSSLAHTRIKSKPISKHRRNQQLDLHL